MNDNRGKGEEGRAANVGPFDEHAASGAPAGGSETRSGGWTAPGWDGVGDFEHRLMGLVRDTAADAVHVTRDVATETVRAVGDVGDVTVRTASGLLVGVAQGVRDVAETLMGRRPGGGPDGEGAPRP